METILQKLVNVDCLEFNDSWSEMFFNVSMVKALAAEVKDPCLGAQVLGAGERWRGSGWTTGKAARAVYQDDSGDAGPRRNGLGGRSTKNG